MADGTAKPVIFISYSHKDEPDRPGSDEIAWLTFAQSFLAPVVKVGIFDIWVDEHLHGGDALDPEIKKKLAACDIFVLLASRFSLASTYIVETEIATMRKRQRDGEDVRLYSIILSPVPDAALAQLKDLLLRPKDGKPLSLMSKNDREVAMATIADDIAAVAQVIADKKRAGIEAHARALIERQLAAAAVEIRANKSVTERFAPPHYAFVDISHLPETAYEHLVGRDDKLKRLDDAWSDSKTNVISLVAEGGAGKSALVNEWLKRLQTDNYRGAEVVLGWSFYSQGSKERATAADEFLNWTLSKLDIELETTSATAKGEAIAEAITQRRVLLVLDGVEPLQHGLDAQLGQLKDQGLRALLRRFAAAPPVDKHALILLTSRLAVKDIARWKDSAAPVIDIERLSVEAGAALLRDNGTWGTDSNLEAAVHDFGGHPLALGLLANFLKETQVGDVRRRDHIRAYFADPNNPRHDHAKRVMESYEREWLAEQPQLLAIMHIVGLFERPASGDCLTALRAEPPIKGLTDQIVHLDDSKWQRAVSRLREARLLSPLDAYKPDALDAHPLVREWFGERLRHTNELAWKAAHERLYNHLCVATKEGETPTLEDLAPLYQAVAHGCQAGLYRQTLDKVVKDRIWRWYGIGDSEFYSIRHLGSIGPDLTALIWFFEKPYESVVQEVSKSAPTLIGNAAFCLGALGRISEAIAPFRETLKLLEIEKNWSLAAKGASNLSSEELLTGQIDNATVTADKALKYARLSHDNMMKVTRRAGLAKVLHAAGKRVRAEQQFKEAERQQKKSHHIFRLLYSAQGYWYCDLLLAKCEWQRTATRAQTILKWEQSADPLHDRGFARLSLARALLGQALQNPVEAKYSLSVANSNFNQATSFLQRAAVLEFLVGAFLHRAVFRRSVADWNGAARDLEEAEEIAEPGPMRLYLCDIALERARLAFARVETFAPLNGILEKENPPKPFEPSAELIAELKSEAQKQLKTAADYIEKCGYHRRDEELAELQAVLRGEKKFADLPPRV